MSAPHRVFDALPMPFPYRRTDECRARGRALGNQAPPALSGPSPPPLPALAPRAPRTAAAQPPPPRAATLLAPHYAPHDQRYNCYKLSGRDQAAEG
jgi:hypothetical protein